MEHGYVHVYTGDGKGKTTAALGLVVRELAARGLAFVRELWGQGKLDLLVLDEINVALHLKLLDLADVLEVVRSKPAELELVCTGRQAPKQLIAAADLVTEMVNIKHYYDAGILARDGIER